MKKRIFKLVVGLILIGISIVPLNAVIVMNDPACPFQSKYTSMQICMLITESASQLLQSASEAFRFMNEVEIAENSGLNIGSALQQVDLAAVKAEQALKMFHEIIAIGSEAGYDETRIGKLKVFNYKKYASENSLNPDTMGKVGQFLGKGNVLGLYQCHADNLETLLTILDRIRKDLLVGRLSEKKVLWSLLQQYNTIMMLGNYASLVFYQI